MSCRHSSLLHKPLEVDLAHPLPPQIRAYVFTATQPLGERSVGDHKIQLMLPGQARGQRASFDYSDARVVLLLGYEPKLDVFVLWDAGLYPRFPFSRNVQVKAATIYAAFAGLIAKQERRLRGHAVETVLAARSDMLGAAIQERVKLTIDRVAGTPS